MKRKIILSTLGLTIAALGITATPDVAQANASASAATSTVPASMPAMVMGPSIDDLIDDVLVMAGLTGGNNRARIRRVLGKGSLVFSSGIGGGKVGLLKASPPRVDAEISCRRSGYRPSQLGTKKWNAKGLKNATQTATGYSKMAIDQNDEKIWWTLHEACADGKTAITLPVTAVGNCQNVKAVSGPSNQVVTAPKRLATFKLSCNMYDAASISKCAGGGCG